MCGAASAWLSISMRRLIFFFSSRRRHTRCLSDWSSDVCSSDLGGIVGRFMSSFGFTSAFAIAVSLLVSFTLTPMLCSRFIKRPDPTALAQHSSKDSFVFKHLDNWYTRMLTWSMAHRGVIVGASACVILSIAPLFMFVGKNFLPQDDQSQYNVLIRTPEGTSIAATTNLAEQIAQDVRKLPGVAHTLMTAGGSADKSVNNAVIYVKLTDIDQRQVSQQQLMQRTPGARW